MIDKRIFYCWFGRGEMSELNKHCIESWKMMCPDYEIVEINESNFDYNVTPYCKEAYENGNWSYVSNTARLEILKHNSGFYLDTDVQLLRPLDDLRVFDKGFITEFLTSQPDSGVLGCGANYSDFYNTVYENLLPGRILHKEFIKELYKRYDVHGQSVQTFDDGFTILGEEWFPSVRTGLITRNTIGIHYFENTWKDQWRNVTDDFIPFPKYVAYIGNECIHSDKNPEVAVQVKTFIKKLESEAILCKLDYFFNPKVISVVTAEFAATRIQYNKLARHKTTLTPGGSVVTWLDI